MSVSPCTFRQPYIEKGTVGMRPNMNHGREKKNQMLICEIILPTPCGEERGVVIRGYRALEAVNNVRGETEDVFAHSDHFERQGTPDEE